MASKLNYTFMKNKDNISKLLLLSKYQLVLIIVIMSVIQPGLFSTKAMAEVEATFLYTLSDFNGLIPYNWVNISVDEEVNNPTFSRKYSNIPKPNNLSSITTINVIAKTGVANI